VNNGMPLCWECHDRWHTGYRWTIPHTKMWDYERDSVIQEMGEDWLNTYYPDHAR
jgi:hypothetical protein